MYITSAITNGVGTFNMNSDHKYNCNSVQFDNIYFYYCVYIYVLDYSTKIRWFPIQRVRTGPSMKLGDVCCLHNSRNKILICLQSYDYFNFEVFKIDFKVLRLERFCISSIVSLSQYSRFCHTFDANFTLFFNIEVKAGRHLVMLDESYTFNTINTYSQNILV